MYRSRRDTHYRDRENRAEQDIWGTEGAVARERSEGFHVTYVSLARCRLDDVALQSLRSFHYLRTLHLEGTDISDQDLQHLARLHRLERLDLSGTKVTDDGLLQLESLRSLLYLNLSDTPVTDSGIARLKRALPNLEVVCAGNKGSDWGQSVSSQ